MDSRQLTFFERANRLPSDSHVSRIAPYRRHVPFIYSFCSFISFLLPFYAFYADALELPRCHYSFLGATTGSSVSLQLLWCHYGFVLATTETRVSFATTVCLLPQQSVCCHYSLSVPIPASLASMQPLWRHSSLPRRAE